MDLTKTLIFMTSNVGAREIASATQALGFVERNKTVKNAATAAALSPNRVLD